ncbi:hypothetical protein ACYSTU_20075 [Pseudomonas glycinis]
MMEVIGLLQKKNRKKKEKADNAKSNQEAFTKRAKQFIADTLEIFSPLNHYGVSCTKERVDVTRDFGEGEITLELEKLIVKEGGETVVTLTPLSSKDYGTDGMRFQAESPRTGTHSILYCPPPFGQHMGWHMRTNEDAKGAEPEYLKLDRAGWISIIRDHLLADLTP